MSKKQDSSIKNQELINLKAKLFPHSVEEIPSQGSTDIMRKFGMSDGYPAKVISKHFDAPIFIIVVFDFRRAKWTDTDGDSVDLLVWYSEKEDSNV